MIDAAAVIAADVTAGRRSASDVLSDHVARHEASHARLNALVQPRHEQAAIEACQGPRGPLAGVPVSIKDCFPVRGLRATLGIPGRCTAPDQRDADIVTRLRAAGAVIVGKANVPQAMYLHETDNPVYGRTNHPFMAERGPGGSTGGDAALVAAGVVPLAVGNDLAGSLRQPAHVCGIAAIMPRSTALGEGGAIDTMPSLQVMRPRAGFLARHAGDLELAYNAVASSPMPEDQPVRRVGWWDTTGLIPASPAIRRGVAEAVTRLHAAGIEPVRLDGALVDEAAWLHLAILSADGGGDIKRLFQGVRPMPGVYRLLRLANFSQRSRSMVAGVARLVGRRIEADGLARTGPRDADGFAALIAARDALFERLVGLVTGCDAIVCPASALPALRHGSAAELILAAAPCLAANLFDLAAGTVPVTTVRADEQTSRPWSIDPVLRSARATDRGSAGLPVGVQVIAPPGRGESTVFSVMHLLER